jgi:hypothetical protein
MTLLIKINPNKTQFLFISQTKKNVHVIGTAKRILLEYCGVKHIEVDGLLIKSKEEI